MEICLPFGLVLFRFKNVSKPDLFEFDPALVWFWYDFDYVLTTLMAWEKTGRVQVNENEKSRIRILAWYGFRL